MGCDTYSVLYGDVVLAAHMSLDNALLFIGALFTHFYNEENISYIIHKEEQ